MLIHKQNSPKGSQSQSCPLILEHLEPRIVLSGIINGIEADGDEYQIKLTGPGAILDGSLENLTVSNTNISSRLAVTITSVAGDGVLNVAEIDTSGSNLGVLEVDGDLGSLLVGRMIRLDAQTLGVNPAATRLFNIAGNLSTLKAPGGIFNANITIAGDTNTLRIGERDDPAANISNSSITIWGNLGQLRLRQSLTGDSILTVHGDLGSSQIDKSIMSSTLSVEGNAEALKISGAVRNNSFIIVDGDLLDLNVKKTVSDATFDIGGNLQAARFGNDVQDSAIFAQSLDSLIIKDDLDDTRIGISGDLFKLKANDSQSLSLRVSGTLHSLKIKNDLDQALISALNEINLIRVGQDLFRSTIVGGIDIGNDFLLDTLPGGDDTEWGNIFIRKIIIRGDMIDSSIAAGVSPRGAFYGDGNDEPSANDIGTARILRISVKGEISSTGLPGESYAISAADGIDQILSSGRSFTGTAGVLRQEF